MGFRVSKEKIPNEEDTLKITKLIADCFILNNVNHSLGVTAMMGLIAMSIKAKGASFDSYLKFMHDAALAMQPIFDEGQE